ncbi:unnamed protein product [Penicillium bialowiezense]
MKHDIGQSAHLAPAFKHIPLWRVSHWEQQNLAELHSSAFSPSAETQQHDHNRQAGLPFLMKGSSNQVKTTKSANFWPASLLALSRHSRTPFHSGDNNLSTLEILLASFTSFHSCWVLGHNISSSLTGWLALFIMASSSTHSASQPAQLVPAPDDNFPPVSRVVPPNGTQFCFSFNGNQNKIGFNALISQTIPSLGAGTRHYFMQQLTGWLALSHERIIEQVKTTTSANSWPASLLNLSRHPALHTSHFTRECSVEPYQQNWPNCIHQPDDTLVGKDHRTSQNNHNCQLLASQPVQSVPAPDDDPVQSVSSSMEANTTLADHIG